MSGILLETSSVLDQPKKKRFMGLFQLEKLNNLLSTDAKVELELKNIKDQI